jgi:hypothetical protein
MLGHSSIVLTADTYTSVLPNLAHHAAEVTARLILTSAATTTTSRAIHTGHHTSHKRPARRPPRLGVPSQRSTPPSATDDAPAGSDESAEAQETVVGPTSLERHHVM